MAPNDDDGKTGHIPFTTADMIPKFSGEDMTYCSSKWAQDIEDNAEIFNWTAQQKLIIARRSLTGTAELWLRTEKAFKTYEELRAALQKEFPETLNSKQMHELMSKRTKQRHESSYQYMLIMKELGRRAKFPDYVSIQYIIDGIPDSQTNKMCLYGVSTYAALKEKLNIYDAIKQKVKKDYERDVKLEEHRRAARTTNPEKSSKVVLPRCYRCGDPGHMSRECTNGTKCFKCNSFGHIGTQCKGNTYTKRAMCIEETSDSSEGATGEAEVGNNGNEWERMNEAQD